MKRITAVLLLIIFCNTAVAYPFASGGGSSSSSEKSHITTILLLVVVAGVTSLMVSDILSDNSDNSQDNLARTNDDMINVKTGVNWKLLNSNVTEPTLPVLALSVFPGTNGRDFARYFRNLIAQGNNLYYDVYSSLVSFGNMNSTKAAATGFSFLDSQWFIAADSSGLLLYIENSDTTMWDFQVSEWDSVTIRNAAADFLEFSRNH